MEYLKTAFLSIKQNKGRSFLTMLGIIIGIASVITILAIGNGMKAYVNRSLDDFTSGAVTINIDQKKTSKFLTISQLKQIEEVTPEAYGITPSFSTYANLTDNTDFYCSVKGGTPVIARDSSHGICKGRFFRDDDVESASPVCVTTQQSAILLFGTDDVLDKTISIEVEGKSVELTIIGVLKSSDEDVAQAKAARKKGEQYYYIIEFFVPYTIMTQKFNIASENFTSFAIYTQQGQADDTAMKVKSIVENMLDLRGEGAVVIESFASIAGAYNKILNIVTMVVALIAAISLLVGGIGVMNIMTVSVTERTREIGIKKSLGAKTAYIMIQFLTESALITLIGGFIGMAMGALFTKIASNFMSFPPVIDPMNVLLVVAISVADGIFFGIYPAKRAAKMSPIDALKQE
ncbi:MAG: FtsX-like permease family protein [Butyrivibrio sp.]|nr:FtsX-like permease family protein [Butyrivibrio sp.]